jgi:signal transduction histidine kinase
VTPGSRQHGEAGLTQVEIRTDIPQEVPLVRGDRVALREVFANLIQNGIHAMPEGGPLAIRVAVAPDAPEVTVLVIDGGKGIAAELQEKVFQPFFTTKPRGTGLGLSIARHKLEEAGGRIAVESPVGEAERLPGAKGPGALFRIALPVAGRTPEPKPAASETVVGSASPA